jgi:LysM repeat protein
VTTRRVPDDRTTHGAHLPAPPQISAGSGPAPPRCGVCWPWSCSWRSSWGIPLLLLALTPTSFPQGLPGPGDLLEGLTQRDDGTLFLAVLTVAAWVGWATFAVAVLLEVPAQLRGVPPVRVRGLGVQQSLAGGLVAAVFAIVLVPGAASAAVRARRRWRHLRGEAWRRRPRRSRGHRRHELAGRGGSPALVASPGGAAAEPGATQARSGRVHVVQPGDTLWDLAEQHLGDGGQWRRIARLNYDRVQPDGDRLDRTHVLRAGWRLELPVSAQPARATAHEHVVRPGETLSGIAAQELGDATRYPELARATEGVVQPDGGGSPTRTSSCPAGVSWCRRRRSPGGETATPDRTADGPRTGPRSGMDPSWGDAAPHGECPGSRPVSCPREPRCSATPDSGGGGGRALCPSGGQRPKRRPCTGRRRSPRRHRPSSTPTSGRGRRSPYRRRQPAPCSPA